MKLITLSQGDCLTPEDFRYNIRLSKVNEDYMTCLLAQLSADYSWPELELHSSELFEAIGLVRSIEGAKGVMQLGCNDVRELDTLYNEDKFKLNEGYFTFHQIELIAFDERLFNKEWLKDNLEIVFKDILQTKSPIAVPHVIWYIFNNDIQLVVDNIYSIEVEHFLNMLVDNILLQFKTPN